MTVKYVKLVVSKAGSIDADTLVAEADPDTVRQLQLLYGSRNPGDAASVRVVDEAGNVVETVAIHGVYGDHPQLYAYDVRETLEAAFRGF